MQITRSGLVRCLLCMAALARWCIGVMGKWSKIRMRDSRVKISVREIWNGDQAR